MEGDAGVWPGDGVAISGPTRFGPASRVGPATTVGLPTTRGLAITVGLPTGVGLGARAGVGTAVAITTEGREISGESSRSGRVCCSIIRAATDVGRTSVEAACDSVDEPGYSRSAGRRVGTALPRPSPPSPPISPPTPHPRIRETPSTRAAKRHLWCLGLGSQSPYSCGDTPDSLLFLSIFVSVLPPAGYLLR